MVSLSRTWWPEVGWVQCSAVQLHRCVVAGLLQGHAAAALRRGAAVGPRSVAAGCAAQGKVNQGFELLPLRRMTPPLLLHRQGAPLAGVWGGRRHLPHGRQEGRHCRGSRLHSLLW